MQKKKFITASIVIIALFALVGVFAKKKQEAPASGAQEAAPISVAVVRAGDSKLMNTMLTYPATIVGDQEATITARTAGTITTAPFAIGDSVQTGQLLAKIDDTGSLQVEDGFKSSQVQQSQLAVDQAKKAYDVAKKSYDRAKAANDPNTTALKGQRDIAKIQYENALISAKSTVDAHLATSPIAGKIITMHVSVGDSVTLGQPIATVSKTDRIKVQFYVEQEKASAFKRGMSIEVDTPTGTAHATITNSAPQADSASKRFLIEAVPARGTVLAAGTIVTVRAQLTDTPQVNGILLPLSALTIGQNETYLFIADNGIAKKLLVKIERVSGETAEISGSFTENSQIITKGNKLLQDGTRIATN